MQAIDGLLGPDWNDRSLNKFKCFPSLEKDLMNALTNQCALDSGEDVLSEPEYYFETQTFPVVV